MRLPDEPGFPVLPPGRPTRDLLLAQALDACITAERRLPGSSQEIIARQPAWARGDLQRLIGLAGSLDAATSNAVMSNEFRGAARARLMRRIGGDTGLPEARRPGRPAGLTPLSMLSSSPGAARRPRRTAVWAWRATAGLAAAALAVTATLTASASALPGEPLYRLKEAREELAVRLASDDQQRALALLQQANARLDETARLLEQGRTLDATVTTLRYDQGVQRATMSYVGTIDSNPASAPATVNMEASLGRDQDVLQALLTSAPEPARADLREALVATERGRALVADLRPVERALGRGDVADASAAAAVPTMAAEDEASPIVEPTVPTENPTAVPTRRPVLVLATSTPVAVIAESRDDASGADTAPVVAQVGGFAGGDGGDGRADQSHGSNQHGETALVSPSVNARDDAQAGSAEANGRGDDRPPDLANVSTGRGGSDQGDGADGRASVPGPPNQDDRNARGQDTLQPSVARQPQESAGGGGGGGSDGARGSAGKSSGGDDAGATAHAAPVAPAPERATAGGGAASTGDRNSHDNGGDGRVAPTPKATPTKPPSNSASASPTSHHNSDGEQKSTPAAPAPHNGSGDHQPGNDSDH